MYIHNSVKLDWHCMWFWRHIYLQISVSTSFAGLQYEQKYQAGQAQGGEKVTGKCCCLLCIATTFIWLFLLFHFIGFHGTKTLSGKFPKTVCNIVICWPCKVAWCQSGSKLQWDFHLIPIWNQAMPLNFNPYKIFCNTFHGNHKFTYCPVNVQTLRSSWCT